MSYTIMKSVFACQCSCFMKVDLGIELNTNKGGMELTCLSIQHAGVFFDTDVNRQPIIKLVNTKLPYKRENP